MSSRRPQLLTLALLVLAPLLVFAICIGYEFVTWDDSLNLYGNPNFNPLTSNSVTRFWTQQYEALYIPFSYTVWALIAQFARYPQATAITGSESSLYNPHFFHAFNLLLHLGSVVVVWLILRRLIDDLRACTVGALLFAIHPFQVEPVVWISGMRDLLGGLLSFLAIWQYLKFAQAENSANRPYRHYALGTAFFVLALLSKPSAVTLPLAVWALDCLALCRPARKGALAMLPWVALAIPLILIAFGAQPVAAEFQVPWAQRPLIVVDAFAFYVRQLIWPRLLLIDYQRHPGFVLTQPATAWLVAALPLLAIGGLVATRRWRPWMSASLGVSVAALLPVLGIVPFVFTLYSTVADRYAYVALLGAALAVAYALRGRTSRPMLLLCAVVLVGYGGKAHLQARTWQNTLTLFNYTSRANPDSYLAHKSLGMALLRMGDRTMAERHYVRATQLNPNSYEAWMGLAEVHAEREPGKAIDDCRTALDLMERLHATPTQRAEARSNLGTLLQGQGKLAEAETEYRLALAVQPDNLLVAQNLRNLLAARTAKASAPPVTPATAAYHEGNQLAQAGRFNEAAERYRAAVKLDPMLLAAYENMGVVLVRSAKNAEAARAWQQARKLNPKSVSALVGLGDLALGDGKFAKAIGLYQDSLAVRRDRPGVYYNLGMAYSKIGKKKEAATQWQAALQVDPNFAPARQALLKLQTSPFP